VVKKTLIAVRFRKPLFLINYQPRHRLGTGLATLVAGNGKGPW